MWSLAWPWVLLALPLPFIVRYLLPEATGMSQAGVLLVFERMKNRSA